MLVNAFLKEQTGPHTVFYKHCHVRFKSELR